MYENYPCQFSGIDAKGRAMVTNLEEFGKVVLEDLWNAIQVEFPEVTEPVDSCLLEKRLQTAYQVRVLNTFSDSC